MRRRLTGSTRTDTLLPYTTLCRSRLNANYDNISQYYKIKGYNERGIQYGNKGVELAKKYDQPRSLTYAYNWIGESYFYQGHRGKGIAYLNDALQISVDLESAYRTMEIHCSLYECYHSIGDDRNALMHFVRYRAIHDSDRKSTRLNSSHQC